jgi:hypothetical protein
MLFFQREAGKSRFTGRLFGLADGIRTGALDAVPALVARGG